MDVRVILNRVFSAALEDGRMLTARELMGAIGLQRTNIYGAYAHVQQRRKQHNATVGIAAAGESAPQPSDRPVETPAQVITRLRRETKAAKNLAATYAEQIRRLTRELHEARHSGPTVIDGRGRFSDRGDESLNA